MRLEFAVLLTAVAVSSFAAAQDYPKLQPGLWEMTHSSNRASSHPSTTTMCLDATVQKEMVDIGAGAMKGMCSKHDFRLSGGRGTGDYVCDMGNSKMHSKLVMVMNGDTGYRTEIHATYDPPFMGVAQVDTVVTARRLGPCKPGQRPGDMTTANGHTVNIRDVLKGNGGK
ncbi:MAG TPA: DUF3617 family protein [Casimicrobiaceae bacterium]|nr:DUF3617 family protein [Casimicrobiaceae bacterium]